MTISTLPEWPIAGDPNYAEKIDAVGVALPTTIEEMNLTNAETSGLAANAEAAAGSLDAAGWVSGTGNLF